MIGPHLPITSKDAIIASMRDDMAFMRENELIEKDLDPANGLPACGNQWSNACAVLHGCGYAGWRSL
jgi:hypothetical protein